VGDRVYLVDPEDNMGGGTIGSASATRTRKPRATALLKKGYPPSRTVEVKNNGPRNKGNSEKGGEKR